MTDGRPLATEREILFHYVNYRGEPSERRVKVISVRFGTSEHHTQPQWLMLGIDLARNVEREFAMRDMTNVIGASEPVAWLYDLVDHVTGDVSRHFSVEKPVGNSYQRNVRPLYTMAGGES